MAPPPATPEPLAPDVAARLAEFARACKAATRIVSMYPATHPAIQSALSRITDAGNAAIEYGRFAIGVRPDTLLVGGRGLSKPEPAAGELAALLHQHLIGEITLSGSLDHAGWHALLSMLAKSPEEVRSLGGATKEWERIGTKAISFVEIDYAELLRERSGGVSATWDRILDMLGEELGTGMAGMNELLKLTADPSELAAFAQRLQERGKAAGDDPARQRRTLVEMMQGLASHAAQVTPDKFDSVLTNMADAAAQMTPDMLLTLITEPPKPATPEAPRLDLAGELQSRLTDQMLSKFLVDNIVKDRGATNRLAAAFSTLVPPGQRQQDILAAAAAQAQEMFKDDPGFESVWTTSSEMLMSYSDAQFVSEGYARELTSAQTQAVDIEQVGDDPPVRIRAWLSTISTEDIRGLDQKLILDLLRIEDRPDAWNGVLDTAVTDIDELVLVGDLMLASQLLDAISGVAKKADSPFASAAAGGITKLVEGPMVRHLALSLRQATDDEFAVAKQMCTTIGPALVKPMANALLGEDNARMVRRLRDILISFGAAAREYANELRSSQNPAIRRAAIDLLRALGGDAALPELRKMLDDHEPGVQREALRAILQIGTNEAYQLLETALKSGAAHTRDAIMQSLGGFRDERAAPLLVHILTTTGYTGALEATYTQTIDSLGKVAIDDRSVAMLETILRRGEWWAPGRTSRLRAAAARALRSIDTPAAERALDDGEKAGGGVKRAVKVARAEPVPARRPGRKAV